MEQDDLVNVDDIMADIFDWARTRAIAEWSSGDRRREARKEEVVKAKKLVKRLRELEVYLGFAESESSL